MSKKFLYSLNGEKTGKFKKWLEGFKGEPRIAWYPSAGDDFRDLMFLNQKYAAMNPGVRQDPKVPDIFLHTDYYPWKSSCFLDNSRVYADDRTSITLNYIEELPRCDLPLDPGIVDFPGGSIATGKVLFFEVNVVSNLLGEFSAPIVYAFAENGAFCAEKILPHDAVFSHLIHVRYGGGCGGGGKSTGIWLLNVLQRLQCEYFISDGHYGRQSGDKRTYMLYPELAGPEDVTLLEPIRLIKSEQWSNHGDVSWNLVRRT